MRHFWLSVIAAAIAVAFASALAALLFRAGLTAPAILALLAGAVTFMMLVGRIRALCRVLAGFAAAIEAGDTTVSFDLGSPSTALGRTAAVMSRLLVSSRRRVLELETRKLYYDRILRVLTHEMRNSLTPATCITVADNGPGLPPAVAASLFQPFVTTKEGGAGIGLCLSRQIARAHGGDLTIRSTPRGATATITL